jgi:UDP-2,3-diacylglucosamine hydrolase
MIPQYASALLISDIHLTPSMPLTAQRFFDFCEKDAPHAESVFILGDLFEYWVGDDAFLHSPFQQEVKHALANLATKTKIYYVHGNRDFLIGSTFLKNTGMTLLHDPALIEIAQQQYIVSHGDSLCTADIGYQVFRHWVRKPWLQKLFLQLPLGWRRAIANHLRTSSYTKYQRAAKASRQKNRIRTDVTQEACAALIKQYSCNRLIHGHTHLPAHHQEQLGELAWDRWVLSDWDLDHPESTAPRASALQINSQGVRYLDLIKA